MSFIPKLLIFVGWMLIFALGIVDSASIRNKEIPSFEDEVVKKIPQCLGERWPRIAMTLNYSSNSFRPVLAKMNESYNEQLLRSDDALSPGRNSSEPLTDFKNPKVTISPQRSGVYSTSYSVETSGKDGRIYYIENEEFLLQLNFRFSEDIMRYEVKEFVVRCHNETLRGKDMNIPETTTVSQDSEQLFSGGPVAAKPPNGLFGSTVAAVIAAVVLHVGTIICS